MATYTSNFNLKKLALEDFYNVDDFNGNSDIIDTALLAASVITDAASGSKFKWGIDNGIIFLEEVG